MIDAATTDTHPTTDMAATTDATTTPDASDAGRGAADAGDAGGPGVCSAPLPTTAWAADTAPGRLHAVFAVTADDVWVTTDHLVRNWNGVQWTDVLTNSHDQYFDSVWASGPHDVWVGGTSVTHWDGAAWTDRTPPLLAFSAVPPASVSTYVGEGTSVLGRASDDVWAMNRSSSGGVARWDGVSWTD